MTDSPDSLRKLHLILLCLLTLLVLIITVYVRIRLSGVPLERDEGEYAYMGQLLLKGFPPYAAAYTMKLPGTSMIYALIMSIFGQTSTGIRIGFIFVNIASTAMVFLLARRMFTIETGLAAGAFYALLSLSESVLGVFAHATHLVVLFSLAGILMLWDGLAKRQRVLIYLAGVCFGMSLLMKQHAVFLVVFALAFQIWPKASGNRRLFARDASCFLIGVVLPYCAVALWLVKAGVFDKFWFWTVDYAREYTTGSSLSAGMHELRRQVATIAKTNAPIWVVAGIGLVMWCHGSRPRTEKRFLTGYLITSIAMICPGFYFRAHYFVMLLPAIALLAAAATSSLFSQTGRSASKIRIMAPALLLAMIGGYALVAEKDCNFDLGPEEVSRKIYTTNPFPEAVAIAAYLHTQTTEKDTIAVLGSEPEILFYADRLSATGHIYMYGLMETHKYAEVMQRQLINEIESAAPAFIVVVGSPTSWLPRPNSVNNILVWADTYLPLRYDEVSMIEIFNDRPSRFLWGAVVDGYETEAPAYVSIYKRR